MLVRADNYDDLVRRFEWRIPEFYNIGVDVCDRWAATEPARAAILCSGGGHDVATVTYGQLREQSDRLAQALRTSGIVVGERIAIMLSQSPETVVSHIATYKLGAIALPLFRLFGPEAVAFRLKDSGARVLITDAEGLAKVLPIRDQLPGLELILSVDGHGADAEDFGAFLGAAPAHFAAEATRAEDPALIIYTSGTTGMPKGALHAHRVLLGHLPGVEMSHDFLPHPGDRMWTPADWAWIGGLLDVLLPALHLGIAVVAHRFEKFTGEAAFHLLRDTGVRNAFIPPTALKMMRAAHAKDPALKVALRSVGSGGETLGKELLEWGREALGVSINEFYGQTECNMIVSSCSAIMASCPGLIGRPVPGHDIAIVDDRGEICKPGTQGHIAARRGSPVMFLGYWNNPQATEAKFIGDWLITGDIGEMDAHGWIRFIGRDDDIITSSGYRIGPGEIEDCLLRHPAVRMAGVVGKPDPLRTEIVKAYIVLKDQVTPSEALEDDIKAFVRTRLAAHEYPREIAFVDDIPMTATGKIVRGILRKRAAGEK
jgi:acetyl-CoA synthetase